MTKYDSPPLLLPDDDRPGDPCTPTQVGGKPFDLFVYKHLAAGQRSGGIRFSVYAVPIR